MRRASLCLTLSLLLWAGFSGRCEAQIPVTDVAHIAVSVWNEDEVIAKEGGVIGGRTTTFMLQMKGEAEAAWVFSLVGRLRY